MAEGAYIYRRTLDTDVDDLHVRDGQPVTLLNRWIQIQDRDEGDAQYDIMYRARFADGAEFDLWAEEIFGCWRCPDCGAENNDPFIATPYPAGEAGNGLWGAQGCWHCGREHDIACEAVASDAGLSLGQLLHDCGSSICHY